MPRNAEKKVCTVCNQTVDTDDAESDSGSVLGSHLEEVASNPQMMNANQLANLDPNKMYLTCGNCTQTFLKMWQLLRNLQRQKDANQLDRNGVGSNGGPSTSKGHFKSLALKQVIALSSTNGDTNRGQPSANSEDLQNANAPLNDHGEDNLTDNAKETPGEALGSGVKKNSIQNAGQKSNGVVCTTTGTGRNLLGLPPLSPPAGKKDDVFLFPPPRDTLLQKQKAKKAPTPPTSLEWKRERTVADISYEEWVDFFSPPHSEDGLEGASPPTTPEILELVIDQSSEDEEEREAEPSTPNIFEEPDSTPVIPPSKDDEIEQAAETLKKRTFPKMQLASRRPGIKKRRCSKGDRTYHGRAIPVPRRRRPSKRLAIKQLTDIGIQSGVEVGTRKKSGIGKTSDKAGSPVPSTSSGVLLSRPCTTRPSTGKSNTAVKQAIAKKKVPKRKSSKAKTPVKKVKTEGKGKRGSVRRAKMEKKVTEPSNKRAKHRHCCHLCPQDFETKNGLKIHWIKYHRINPAAVSLMP